jgi:CheY-like chemotaxis protein/DNA-binding protein Fis
MKMNDIEKGTVLVVDDQPEEMNVLISSLQACGLTILVVQQGEQAIALAEQFKPDMILLNVLIPAMDGFEICRRLKAHEATQDIPVIFMTSSSETVDKVKGLEVGGVDYLTKPLQPKEVVARVTAYLTIRKLQEQLQEYHPLEEKHHERFHQSRKRTTEEEQEPLWRESMPPRSTIPDKKQVARIVNQMSEQHDQEELNFREAVEAYEKRLIAKALEQHRNNMAKTATNLEIPLRTLYRKIKKYRLL